jgi:hypothetical protein
MELLPLDDPRWKQLNHRNWSDGKPSDWTPDAPFVPDELAKLVKNPADRETFRDLWPWLCSEGTTWPAAYAALPYFVAFSKRLPPEQRADYLSVVGLIVTDACPDDAGLGIKDYLRKGYAQALDEVLPLVAETLNKVGDATDVRYLLASIAALKGNRKLAAVLQNLDCICGNCPKCGECVYPPELEEAMH